MRRAADELLGALERCAVEERLWTGRRRLLAALGERPAELPRELAGFRRAGYGLHAGEKALVPRIAVLEARTAGQRPPESAALTAGADLGAAVIGAGWTGWTVAGFGREAGVEGAPPRTVARMVPPAGDAWRGVAAVHVFPHAAGSAVDDGAPPDGRLVTDVVQRIEALHIGDARLGAVVNVELWIERMDADVLLPPPGALTTRVAPDGMLETLGAHAGAVVARAFRETVWVVAFRASPGAGAKFDGKLVGIDVPALDRTRITALHVPGGVLGDGATRQLLEHFFEPSRAPSLAKPELKVEGARLELGFLSRADEARELIDAVKGRTPYLGVEPGRVVLDPGALGGRAGALAAER